MKRWLAAMAVGLAVAACGGSAAVDDGGGGGSPANALQPLEVGTRWTYETSDAAGGDRQIKEVSVLRNETVGDLETTVLESRRGNSRTLVWLAEIEGRVVRVREESWEGETRMARRGFAPGSLRTPAAIEAVRVGDQFDGDYVEQVLADDDSVRGARQRVVSYVVEAVDDRVRTPAGEFGALRLRKLGDDGGEGKLTWYAPGVGKVREEGGRVEVLQSYSLPKR